jgi:hypothetical protein
MTNDRRPALLVAAVVILVVAAIALFRRRNEPSPAVASARSAPSAHLEAPPSASPEARRARDAMHQQILDALRLRDAGAPPPRAPSPPPSAPAARADATRPADDSALHGSYDPEYIRENVHDQIFPLLRSCYDAALARNPKLSGKLVFSFRLVGDPSVGGVIEEAEFGEGSDIKDTEMETCTRESLLSLTLDKPPSGGGYVTVKYPVVFAPGDDEDEDAGGPGKAGDAGKR